MPRMKINTTPGPKRERLEKFIQAAETAWPIAHDVLEGAAVLCLWMQHEGLSLMAKTLAMVGDLAFKAWQRRRPGS